MRDYRTKLILGSKLEASELLSVNILRGQAMTHSAIERASRLIQHWERRFEFCRLYETCARWTAFLRTFEVRLAALRMRRDVLVGLEEAAQLDVLPTNASQADETRTSEVAELFATAFAESERRLASASETNTP